MTTLAHRPWYTVWELDPPMPRCQHGVITRLQTVQRKNALRFQVVHVGIEPYRKNRVKVSVTPVIYGPYSIGTGRRNRTRSDRPATSFESTVLETVRGFARYELLFGAA